MLKDCCFATVAESCHRKMADVEKKSKAKARRDRHRNVVKRMEENMQAEEGWVSNPHRISRHERRELNKQAPAAGIALVPLLIGNQPSAHSKAYALSPVGMRPSLRTTTTTTTTSTTSTTSLLLPPPPRPVSIGPRPPAPWQKQAVPVAPLASVSFAAAAHRQHVIENTVKSMVSSDVSSLYGVKDPEI